MKSLLVVLSFALLVSCSFDPIATLDNFSGSQNLLIISNNVFPTSSSSYLNISSVYGGQRDLELVIVSGGSGQIVINSVADGQLSISYPNSVNGFTIYQLDGIDNSMGINPNGLNNFDGTFAGSANAFQLTGAADIDTFLNITVYTSAGIGTYLLPVPSSQSQNDYFVLFSSFTGNADFTSIGAIEILFNGSSDVDSIFSFFGIVAFSDEVEEVESFVDIPQQTPLSRSKSPATAKGNSNIFTSEFTSQHSPAMRILPCTVVFLLLLFALF